MLNRRRVLLTLVVVQSVLAGSWAPAIHAGPAVRPNILLIVTDDQRTGTLSMMPAVRRWLGRGGTRYTRVFATTPLCCPSRASILTGLLAHNHGVTGNQNEEDALVAVETSMLQHPMQASGYRTGRFGKYLSQWPITRDPIGWDRWGRPRAREGLGQRLEHRRDGPNRSSQLDPLLGRAHAGFRHRVEGPRRRPALVRLYGVQRASSSGDRPAGLRRRICSSALTEPGDERARCSRQAVVGPGQALSVDVADRKLACADAPIPGSGR